MSNALISLEPKDLTELKGVAQVFAESGLFKDAKSMAQAFVKIMAGREIGIGAFAAMQGIYIVDGKPTYSSNVMAAAIKRGSKYDYRVIELTDERCEIAFYQDGEKIGVSILTIIDARNAKMDQSWDKEKNGWKQKATWQNFPKNMLFARAMSNGVRWFCPDAFDMPVYTPDEMGADIDDENVIDGSIVDTTVTVIDPDPEPPTPPSAPASQPDPDRIIGRDEPITPIVETPAVPEKKAPPSIDDDDEMFTAKYLNLMIDYTIEHSPDIEDGNRYAGGGRLHKALTNSEEAKGDWRKLYGVMTLRQAKDRVDARIAKKNPQPALMNEQSADKVVGGTCKECGDPTNRKDFLGEWFCEDCATEAAEQAHADAS